MAELSARPAKHDGVLALSIPRKVLRYAVVAVFTVSHRDAVTPILRHAEVSKQVDIKTLSREAMVREITCLNPRVVGSNPVLRYWLVLHV